mmetsp:Transcript_21588/g.43626  ORF Transcript_21588/g.43626 Transcript_21588/m.43626 type:complete len:283 (+) Transcript_21588:1236-2084(+)
MHRSSGSVEGGRGRRRRVPSHVRRQEVPDRPGCGRAGGAPHRLRGGRERPPHRTAERQARRGGLSPQLPPQEGPAQVPPRGRRHHLLPPHVRSRPHPQQGRDRRQLGRRPLLGGRRPDLRPLLHRGSLGRPTLRLRARPNPQPRPNRRLPSRVRTEPVPHDRNDGRNARRRDPRPGRGIRGAPDRNAAGPSPSPPHAGREQGVRGPVRRGGRDVRGRIRRLLRDVQVQRQGQGTPGPTEGEPRQGGTEAGGEGGVPGRQSGVEGRGPEEDGGGVQEPAQGGR